MPQSPPIVPTVGSIADRLGVPVHRIRYVVESRGIEPTGRAGNARVFTDADLELRQFLPHRATLLPKAAEAVWVRGVYPQPVTSQAAHRRPR